MVCTELDNHMGSGNSIKNDRGEKVEITPSHGFVSSLLIQLTNTVAEQEKVDISPSNGFVILVIQPTILLRIILIANAHSVIHVN
ncbi:hypothetical protein LOK49_LG06G01302 [Camellia lanceoleosa]|uniref:Uncharacterized protein n=1 Tax=Camellia lanceoleosa TaxID=1840588 RepID=A0ACC0HIJ6_9ERIC|nr:hypothetical protein LOK49_LG06G01302 [Camellia lanceoleosa]